MDNKVTRSHHRSAVSLAVLAEVQPACRGKGPSPLLNTGEACLGCGSGLGFPGRRLEWWRDVSKLSLDRRRRRGDLTVARSYVMGGCGEDRAWPCSWWDEAMSWYQSMGNHMLTQGNML